MTDGGHPGDAVFKRIAECVRNGKPDAETDIPAGSRGQPGAVEWIAQALQDGAGPQDVLQHGLLAGMQVVGRQFAANEIFIPEVLIAARAMKAGFAVLKPAFAGSDAPSRGVFVIGSVRGDLHDIGKNLVAIILEGAGWRIVDLGTDVPPQRFADAIEEHPGCAVGLSALLTTTMINMRETVAVIRQHRPETVILVGGAPVTERFAQEIGADGYAADPTAAVALLDELTPAGE